MKVIVCGGRTYSDKEHLFKVLDALHAESPITTIVTGLGRGADTLGREWASARSIAFVGYPAKCEHGKAAGIIRNNEMLKESKPDLVVAFPGGRGTEHMKAITRKAGVRLIVETA